MPIHVFVDETKSRGLHMAAARCQTDDVAVHRKALRALLLPGQERLHFRHETDARRKKILGVISRFGCFDLRWELLVPKADPLLWIPDAIPLAWVHGGLWRRSVADFSQLREL